MLKGSQRKAIQSEADFRRLVAEFAEKIEHDPYQPGVIHPEVYPDDLQEVIEDLFWVRGFSDATIKVSKNQDGRSIKVEVLTRGGINNKNSQSDET